MAATWDDVALSLGLHQNFVGSTRFAGLRDGGDRVDGHRD